MPTLGLSGGRPWQPPKSFIDRVRRAYVFASQSYVQPEGCVWHMIGDTHRQEIHETLLRGDDAALARILGDPASHELNYGLDPLERIWFGKLSSSEPLRAGMLTMISDTLMPLAESLGARRFWNPEYHPPAPPLEDVDALLADIDAVLGTRLEVPNPFPNEYGIETKRGILGHRVAFAVYQAWNLRNLCGLVGGRKVLEIGGGLGRTAFYARSLGMSDYTIVDIPLTTVSQASFLGATLGPDAIWMIGDDPADQHGRIRLVPPSWTEKTTDTFDVVLNSDSITEMVPEQARAYMRFASEHSKVLFSVNHEANSFCTRELPAMIGRGVPSLRHAYAMRKGYIEEFYFFGPFMVAPPWQVPGPARLEDLLASRSWRITAPLRWLGTHARTVARASKSLPQKARRRMPTIGSG